MPGGTPTREDGWQLVLLGEGEVAVRDMLGRLSAGGYPGWISVEWEKRWHPEIEPPEVALPQHLAVLGSWISEMQREAGDGMKRAGQAGGGAAHGIGIVGTGVIAATHAAAIDPSPAPAWWRPPTWSPSERASSPPKHGCAAEPDPRRAAGPRRRRRGRGVRAQRPARRGRHPGRRGRQAPGRGEAHRRQPGRRRPAHRGRRRGGRGHDRDLPAPVRPRPDRAAPPARRRRARPPAARRGQHQVVPQPGLLRQRGRGAAPGPWTAAR